MQKPDPEILRQTILRAGGEPADAIMIGDSGTDMRTARAARVPVIAVDFGYTEVPIATLQPDRIISSYGELPRLLRVSWPAAVASEPTPINLNEARAACGHDAAASCLFLNISNPLFYRADAADGNCWNRRGRVTTLRP